MIICIIFDFSMAVLFFLFGIGFYKSEGKAVKFWPVTMRNQKMSERNMMKVLCVRLMEKE